MSCAEYQKYLDDESGKIKFPCENCGLWVEKTDACLADDDEQAESRQLSNGKGDK